MGDTFDHFVDYQARNSAFGCGIFGVQQLELLASPK